MDYNIVVTINDIIIFNFIAGVKTMLAVIITYSFSGPRSASELYYYRQLAG